MQKQLIELSSGASVTLAQAGVQVRHRHVRQIPWIPAFAGMTSGKPISSRLKNGGWIQSVIAAQAGIQADFEDSRFRANDERRFNFGRFRGHLLVPRRRKNSQLQLRFCDQLIDGCTPR